MCIVSGDTFCAYSSFFTLSVAQVSEFFQMI